MGLCVPIREKKRNKMRNVNRICNAITEACREMQRCPDDSVQDIVNESLESWETGLRMDHNFNIDPNAGRDASDTQKRE